MGSRDTGCLVLMSFSRHNPVPKICLLAQTAGSWHALDIADYKIRKRAQAGEHFFETRHFCNRPAAEFCSLKLIGLDEAVSSANRWFLAHGARDCAIPAAHGNMSRG